MSGVSCVLRCNLGRFLPEEVALAMNSMSLGGIPAPGETLRVVPNRCCRPLRKPCGSEVSMED